MSATSYTKLDQLNSTDVADVFGALEFLPAHQSSCVFTDDGPLKSWVDEDGYVQRTSIPENAGVLALEAKYQAANDGRKRAVDSMDLNGPQAFAGSIYTSDNWDYTAIK